MPTQTKKPILDGIRGVAILLLAMEKADANRLLCKFSESEIQRIVTSAADLGPISGQDLVAILDLFETDMKRSPGLVGSDAVAERLVDGAVSESAAKRILASVRGDLPPVELWDRLPDLSPQRIASTLGKEHPQVIAFALCRFGAEQAAEVIAAFDPSMRQDIFDRMIDIGKVSDRAIQLLEFHLARELLSTPGDTDDKGIHAQMAGILNRLDRTEVDELLEHFDAIRPKDARALRNLIFNFDDIVRLSELEIKGLMEGVPAERIIIALRNAPEELAAAALAGLTGRNRRMVEMELQSPAEVPEKDIRDARRWIADLAIGLAQDGKIKLISDDEVAE